VDLALQEGQVRPQERQHERPQREVGHILQGVVEFFYA
jgi:hypothetical protein